MKINRIQKAAWKQTTAVIMVAIVIAVREAYISGKGGYYFIALLLLLIPVLNFMHKAKKIRTWFNKDTRGPACSKGQENVDSSATQII